MNTARECVWYEMFTSNLISLLSSMTELWKLLEEKLLCRLIIHPF